MASAGLAVALALGVTGCGAGGADGDGSGDERAPGGVAGRFCEEYAGYQQAFSGGATYAEVLAALRDLEAPPEVADDLDALTRAVEAMATVDTSDPEAVARFQETTSAAAQDANANIIGYVIATCPGYDGPGAGEAGEIVPSASGG
ncbi:MAG TPA: hypothetical protein VIL48_05595 [Acidimicrobiales bacterium]